MDRHPTPDELAWGATRSASGPPPGALGPRPGPPPPPPGALGSRPVPPQPPRGAFDPRAVPPPAGGTLRVGRFVLEREVGRGGMGVVYRAHDPVLGRPVAIKMLGAGDPAMDRGASPETERRLARFEREARTAARLRHPGIVAVHEVGRAEAAGPFLGRPYLVMDLVEGESLEALLRRGPPPPRRVAEMVRDVARAIDHAHGLGVIHRDLKPENILVEPSPSSGGGGRVYVTDFGLARELGSSAEQVTRSGQVLGTPAFMAPEQAQGGGVEVTPAADVYALGAVLYRALAGRPPFDETELIVLLRRVLVDEPEPLRRVSPSVHPDLETIAHECLEKDPGRRYPSAGALADDLDRFIAGELIAARPASRVRKLARLTRRHPALAALALAAAAVLAVVAVAAALGQAEVRRQVAAERERTIAATARAAEDALAAFAREREAFARETPSGAERTRAARDRLLALGLRAVKATATHEALAPRDERARRRAFDALFAYGEEALAAEQWTVAASALDDALALGVDDARARARRGNVDERREQTARARRDAVAAVIEQARAGELSRRPAGREDALFALVRYPETQTVEMLAGALDEVSAKLHAATRQLVLTAAVPDEHERASGEGPIEHVGEALDAWLGDDPLTTLRYRMGTSPPLYYAFKRLQERAKRRRQHMTIGFEQARRVEAGELELARLCCEALGRIGIREGAVDAIARYLAADHDQERAAAAGVALCLLGGERAEELIIAGRDRFTPNGVFWHRVARFVERTSLGEAPVAGGGEAGGGGAGSAAAAEELDAPALNARALTLAGQGDFAGALELLERAVALRPDAAVLRDNLGNARRELGDLEGALADHTRAIELDPRFATAYNNRGIARKRLGDIAGALADYDRAIELEPEHALAHHNRAVARRDSNDPQGALADFDRAIQIDPAYVDAFMKRGLLKQTLGDPEAAMADLDRAVELDPRNDRAYTDRAYVRSARGDYVGMLLDLDRAIELNPRSATAHTNRGLARHRTNQHEQAVVDLMRATELDPSFAFTPDGAASQLERCLEHMLPDEPRAAEIRAFLARIRGQAKTTGR